MFYNSLCLIYQRFMSQRFMILAPTNFLSDVLLDFCFKNLDLSATQLAHLDDCLITLLVIIISF